MKQIILLTFGFYLLACTNQSKTTNQTSETKNIQLEKAKGDTLREFDGAIFDSLLKDGNLIRFNKIQEAHKYLEVSNDKGVKSSITFNHIELDRIYGYLSGYKNKNILFLIGRDKNMFAGSALYLITYDIEINDVVNETPIFSTYDNAGHSNQITTRTIGKDFLLITEVQSNFNIETDETEENKTYSIYQVLEDGVIELFERPAKPIISEESFKRLKSYKSLSDLELERDFNSLSPESIVSNIDLSEFLLSEFGYVDLVMGKLLNNKTNTEYLILASYYNNLNAYGLYCVSVDNDFFLKDYFNFREDWEYGPNKNSIRVESLNKGYKIITVETENEKIKKSLQEITFLEDGYFKIEKQ